MVANQPSFIFRRHDTVGSAAAEEDQRFLDECYIDTGDLAYLKDCDNPLRVIVGRTGAGKTALINQLSSSVEHHIEISPHTLSLNYIANNGVIAFFEEAGVNLSIFYGLLWKHILVVELLKDKFNIRDEESQKHYARKVRQLLYKKDKSKEIAVDYLEKWGDKFWLTTEERIRELTTTISSSLAGSLDASFSDSKLSAEAARNLSSEERKEVISRGQEAVSEVQIRELEAVISVLAENVFDDPQKIYYVFIDMLDEEWADDRIKFRLIKSLLDTIRRFKKVRNVKIVSSMRQDLLDKVIHSTSDPGFQEEKYESLYLYLKWNKDQLKELISKRISYLVKHSYTGQTAEIEDVFSGQVNGQNPIDYLIDRTFLRPRDLILFFNTCIRAADGKPSISSREILSAEHEYSAKRLQSLATEWQIIYPNLNEISQIFFGMRSHFEVSELTEELLLRKYEAMSDDIKDPEIGRLTRGLNDYYCNRGNFTSIRATLLINLFLAGLIGIKTGGGSPIRWSYESRVSISSSSIKSSSTIYIHPMFHRALEIRV